MCVIKHLGIHTTELTDGQGIANISHRMSFFSNRLDAEYIIQFRGRKWEFCGEKGDLVPAGMVPQLLSFTFGKSYSGLT